MDPEQLLGMVAATNELCLYADALSASPADKLRDAAKAIKENLVSIATAIGSLADDDVVVAVNFAAGSTVVLSVTRPRYSRPSTGWELQ
jgi:hypothetical protein